jgi:hypothetical protein
MTLSHLITFLATMCKLKGLQSASEIVLLTCHHCYNLTTMTAAEASLMNKTRLLNHFDLCESNKISRILINLHKLEKFNGKS